MFFAKFANWPHKQNRKKFNNKMNKFYYSANALQE